jgi:hypothetical protein
MLIIVSAMYHTAAITLDRSGHPPQSAVNADAVLTPNRASQPRIGPRNQIDSAKPLIWMR